MNFSVLKIVSEFLALANKIFSWFEAKRQAKAAQAQARLENEKELRKGAEIALAAREAQRAENVGGGGDGHTGGVSERDPFLRD